MQSTTAHVPASNQYALPNLPGDEVHLWFTVLLHTLSERTLESYTSVLSDDERARSERFHAPEDRAMYIVARLLVRLTLSRYTGISPSEWRFVNNSYGRPAVHHPRCFQHLKFNVTHTDGLAACVVGKDMEIGVDAERTDHPDMDELFASEFLSEIELVCMATLPPFQRQARITEYWTLKEAYAKARGLGLSLPFKSFAFSFGKEGIQMHHHAEIGDYNWQFSLIKPFPCLVLALAARSNISTNIRIRVHKVVPPDSVSKNACGYCFECAEEFTR